MGQLREHCAFSSGVTPRFGFRSLDPRKKISTVPKNIANNYEITALVSRDTLKPSGMRSRGGLPGTSGVLRS